MTNRGGWKIHALCLRPGADLRKELERFTRVKKIRAGFVVTAVGSLDRATVRLAGAKKTKSVRRPLEIISLVGTLSPDGPHLHIAIADEHGKVLGGHLQAGCRVRTTCELVVGESTRHEFRRAMDQKTGYCELKIVTK